MLVSIILLAIISLGVVSATSDDATDDDTVAEVTEELELDSSDVDEITADGGDASGSSDVNDDSKLGAGAGEDELSAGNVSPEYAIDVTPNVMSGSAYVAQYGQIITVNGTIKNVTGNVSIRFGYSGNYIDYEVPLVEGKFSKEITNYTAVRNNYDIQVKWAGNDYYKSISWSKKIHVQMVNVTAHDAYYGLNPYFDVNLFNATGFVNLTVNGRNYSGKLENGKLVQEFTNYTLGENTVKMYYEGDGTINPIEKSFTFNVDVNVNAPTIYNYEQAIIKIYLGNATGDVNITLGNESYRLPITTGGVVTGEFENYTIGKNTFSIEYFGDDTFNPFNTTKTFEVLDKENATIISSVYKTASQNFIFINVPHATGNITVTVNGKKEEWTLVNGTVKKDIDPSENITELNVSYVGNYRLNPTNSSFYVNLTDYVVNAKTFANYFNQADDGKLYDFIEDGITLDFRGSIINPDTNNKFFITVNKPINIISSTKDAYIDLNTTAGSLLGENPGNCFAVIRGGSGSNISNIYLHNTELWIYNTTNVVFDNISVVVEDQRVGSGVGATTVRQNSSYVTLKNSYFYTRNNGGSTTFTFSWADHCTFDNNTIKIEGNVGNMLYLNTFNIPGVPTGVPVNTYNKFINNRLYGKEGSSISIGIMVEGAYNIIANNTLYKTSISTSFGSTNANNNTYYNNTLIDGGSLTAQPESVVYGNNVSGSMSTGANSVAYENTVVKAMTVGAGAEAYNNTAGGLTANGDNCIAHENNINGATTVSGAGANVYGNQLNGVTKVTGANVIFNDNDVDGDFTVSGKNAQITDGTINGDVSISSTNITIDNNNINGTVSFTSSAKECELTNNVIKSDDEYAIDLSTSTNNIIKGNDVSSAVYKGKDAINNAGDDNVLEDIYPLEITLTVSVEDILVGQETTVVNVNLNESLNTYVRVVVGNQTHNVKIENGQGSVTLNRDDFVGGEYSVFAFFIGNDEYVPAMNVTTFNVVKSQPSIQIDIADLKLGEDATVTVTVANASGKVNIIVDGVENIVDLKNGVANATIKKATAGTHTVTVYYLGDDNNNATSASATKTLTVISTEITDIKVYGDSYISAVLKDSNGKAIGNANVSYKFGSQNSTVTTDENGTFTLKAQQNVDVELSYNGNGVLLPTSTVVSIGNLTPVKTGSIITASQLTCYAVDTAAGEKGQMFKVTLKDSEGNLIANASVQFALNGNIYNAITDASGVASVQVNINKANTYTCAVSYLGDNKHNATFTAVNVVVNKKATTLTAKAKTFKVKTKTKKYDVTLKTVKGSSIDGKTYFKAGKKVTLKVKGKTYSAKTNKNGKVTFKLKKLNKKGKFTAVITFAGDDTYKAVTKKVKITVR